MVGSRPMRERSAITASSWVWRSPTALISAASTSSSLSLPSPARPRSASRFSVLSPLPRALLKAASGSLPWSAAIAAAAEAASAKASNGRRIGWERDMATSSVACHSDGGRRDHVLRHLAGNVGAGEEDREPQRQGHGGAGALAG